jgi:hypothetical protein
MKLPRVRLGLVLLFGLVYATPSLAQYMYLDTNGDGIHTSADQVNPTGPTVIDLWLDTDSNRDGSLVVCPQGDYPLSIISYAFVLRAVDGTVSWGDFANGLPAFGVHFPKQKTETDLKDGYGGYPALPPGLYRLGQVQVTLASGTPAIQIIPVAPAPTDNNPTGIPYPFDTSFGSACLGTEFDNTLKLNADWFDVEGLPFGTGGSSNGAPVLAHLSDMTTATGESASQPLSATDADRQPVTFSRISGPNFADIANLDAGNGTATGMLVVLPRLNDVGTATIVVGATDGTSSDQKSFQVMVTHGPNHPVRLIAPAEIDVVAGRIRRVPLKALDPDGQAVTFSKVAGPDYMDVATLRSGAGGAVGGLRLAPVLCDAGRTSATISASDGLGVATVDLQILVRTPVPATPSQTAYQAEYQTNSVAVADFNSDGHLDVVAANGSSQANLSVLIGKGDGTLAAATNSPIQGSNPMGIVVGDWNGDTRPDLAVGTWLGSSIAILLGRGDGTFAQGATLVSLGGPSDLAAADMNGDGKSDLVVANGTGGDVSLFLGVGDGTFGPRNDMPVLSVQHAVAVADFDLDGRLDIATSNFLGSAVSILDGLGDGSFRDRGDIAFDRNPFAIVTGDWNWDGKVDLAVSDYGRGKIVSLLGDGGGGFSPGGETAGFGNPQSMAVADFNGDGVSDLLVGDPADVVAAPKASVSICYGTGDGTFSAPRALMPNTSFAVAAGDLNEDGFPDAVAGSGNVIVVWLNDAAGAGAAQARAFSRLNNPRLFPFIAALAPECLRLEPVAGSYQNSDVNYRSIVLSSEGTGSVSEIPAIFESRPPQRDFDRNGVAEIPICFDRKDLNRLFDNLRGRQSVTAHLEGALADGRRFCTPVELDIAGYKRHFIVFLTPNPLNPQATLTYSTTTDGFVRIRVFDLSGRLVRTLIDQPMVPAGDHSVVIDGRNQSGARLASGIYFYQVEAQEGTVRGRMTVLK